MVNYNDPIFNAAHRRGYIEIAISAPTSFIATWVNKYKNDLKVLSMLADVTGNKIVDWSDFTERTLKNFRDIVLDSMSANSAKTTFAKLKSILNDMKNEVDIPCTRFADILVAKKDPVINTYLNEKEIEALSGVETLSPEEEYVKCIFLISTYTGARHSDAMNFSEDDIIEHFDVDGNVVSSYLSYVSQKTHTEANIPVHRNLLACINGYDHNLEVLDYIFNDILRDLCKRAGINAKTKVRHAGVDKIGKKYEFVSSHTARRSFVTNLYMRGVDLETIAKMAGHSDSSMTRRYLCATRGISDNAMKFFN